VSVVRDQPRVRPRVLSTPRRFAQAHVPRPCFVPQPDPGLSVVELSPRKDRAPVPRPLAPLRFLPRVQDAPSLTLSPPVSQNRRAPSASWCTSAEFPRRLWTPFSPAEAGFPVALDQTDRDRPFRGISPLRSLNPLTSPFARRRVTPPPRSLLAPVSPSEITTNASEPQTLLSSPKGTATRTPDPKA